MSFVITAIRTGLGRIIQFGDWATRPAKMKRSPEQQASVQTDVQQLALFQHHLCPFCIKVRRAMHQLNVPIPLKDIKKDDAFRAELETGGGRVKVPCLRIEENGATRWMYESNDIIAYLQQRFAAVK